MRLETLKGVYRPGSIDHRVVGGYRLMDRIGQGGMTEVFRALTSSPEVERTVVVLKLLLPEIVHDEEVVGIFMDEAVTAQGLVHENICDIKEIGCLSSESFIVMDYIWGADLRSILELQRSQHLTMSHPFALYIMSQVCRGLEHAHRHHSTTKALAMANPPGMIHRGLSPRNILISHYGEVKITDFGVEKAAHYLLEGKTRVLKRKYCYMSPEQIRDHTVDRRSDIFSAGAVLYELLTGRRAFFGANDFATLDKVRSAEFPPPTSLVSTIPSEVEAIVMRALSHDPDDRWPSARDMGRELQRALCKIGDVVTSPKLADWMRLNFSAEKAQDLQIFSTQGTPIPKAIVQA